MPVVFISVVTNVARVLLVAALEQKNIITDVVLAHATDLPLLVLSQVFFFDV